MDTYKHIFIAHRWAYSEDYDSISACLSKAYELEKGIVGVYIHGLKNADGEQTTQGANPFYSINNKDGHRLSNYIECYNSPHSTSTYVYDDIKNNLGDFIERALDNRGSY